MIITVLGDDQVDRGREVNHPNSAEKVAACHRCSLPFSTLIGTLGVNPITVNTTGKK